MKIADHDSIGKEPDKHGLNTHDYSLVLLTNGGLLEPSLAVLNHFIKSLRLLTHKAYNDINQTTAPV